MQSLCKEGRKMVSSFDAIAWIDHVPSREVVMPKIFSSAAALRPDASDSTDVKSVGGDVSIFLDFHKELSKRDDWTPQEIETMKAKYLDKAMAYYRTEDKKFLDDLFSSSRQSQTTKDSTVLAPREKSSSRPRNVPFRPKAVVQREIKELADSIEFN
jgi:hypothetical protein